MTALKHYFDFLWAMTEREIKARYKKTVFGFLWVVLNPALQMLIIGVVFSFFIKIPNYFLFLFTGLLPWTFFSSSLSKATPSIVYERVLLQKAKFPIEHIPISVVLSNFFHTIVSVAILFFLFLPLGKFVFPRVLLIVPAFSWLFVFTLGAALLLSSLQVRFRDISFLVQALLTLWFYATPVLYNLELIPEKLYPLFFLNPLTSIFELFHLSFLGYGMVNSQILFANVTISFCVVLLGIIVFKKQHKYFIDQL